MRGPEVMADASRLTQLRHRPNQFAVMQNPAAVVGFSNRGAIHEATGFWQHCRVFAGRAALLRGGRSRGTASATDPRQKSSNIRSISRRRLSNGCHIWGVRVMVFSIFTGQFGNVFSHDTSSNTIGTRFAHIGMHQKGINAFNGTSNDNFAIHWSIKSRAHTWPLQKIVR